MTTRNADMTDGRALFGKLAEPWLGRPGVTASTMMGFPCLRVREQFFASVDREGRALIIKLSAEAVNDAVEAGRGEPFAPNGRVFKQWLAVPVAERRSWPGWIERAHDFVASEPGVRGGKARS